EDNKSDPKEAATAAEKLIVKDKVPVIVGAWGSSMTLAAMPKLEEYGVPMIVETSSAATITKRGNPWIFRISPPSEMEALGLEKYLKDLGIKKADFLAVNTDWGRGAVTAFGDLLKRAGAGVGATEFMDQAATDMNAQITKIKADNGDTLFLTTSVEQITLVLKQAGAAAGHEGDHHRRQLVAEPAHQAGRRRRRGHLPHPLFPPLVPRGHARRQAREGLRGRVDQARPPLRGTDRGLPRP